MPVIVRYSSELYHYGIKGQKWGIQNGPPYPLNKNGLREDTRINKSNLDKINEIFRSMSNRERELLSPGYNKFSNQPLFYDNEYGKQSTAYSVVMSKKGTPVSFLAVMKSSEHPGSGEIAVGTRNDPEYRNKGYAKKLGEKAVNWFNRQNRIDKMYWIPYKNNESSCKIAKDLGFTEIRSSDPKFRTFVMSKDKFENRKGKNRTVFISGSSKTQFSDSPFYLEKLPNDIVSKVDGYMKSGNKIIVGDAPGIDRQVQDYLAKHGYKNVVIYSPGKTNRYSADSTWKIKQIDAPNYPEGSSEWLAAKDKAMQKAAHEGLAVTIKDGASATRRNIEALRNKGAKVMEYELSGDKNVDPWIEEY